MDPNSQVLGEFFARNVQRMLALMARARTIEFHIRLLAEAGAHKKHFLDQSNSDFLRKEVDYPRKKLERHIKDALPSKFAEMIVIRQCADSLAHADYREARRRIDEFQSKFGLPNKPTNESVGFFLYQNIVHADGKRDTMGYTLVSSPKNLIIEEFFVFEKQGYLEAAEHMLGIAEKELRTAMPAIELDYGHILLARGLKYAKRAGG